MNTLKDVLFDDRHMFVGRRMINGVDLECLHDLQHPILVMYRSQECYNIALDAELARHLLQFLFNVVKRDLGYLEQHQQLRPELEYLAAKLGADRPSRSGHHDRFSRHRRS